MTAEIGLPLQNLMGRTDYSLESDLLEGCRRGDLRAFEKLYELQGARMKSIAYNLLGSRTDAEDAVQETFLKLHRSMTGFQGQSSIATWACRILINTCYDFARRRKRELGPPATGERGAPSRVPLKLALEQALARINDQHRMVFLLFAVEGLKHSEIAAILEIPEGTSKSWLFEAKKALKRLLTESRP